jgi:regulator of protease activity HflC (stomatin/prohibitin superfamily)
MEPLTVALAAVAVVTIIFAITLFRSVEQANVAVVTMFGKYRRILREGLNVKLPWEAIFRSLSLQNRALQMEFQAITQDQANVKFSTMIVYAVANSNEDTIKKAVFSFASAEEFLLALQRTIDGSIRQFVAATKQADILGMRAEIVQHTKKQLDEVVSSWGYDVRDIQITDITFDQEIMDSMARVVSSKNLLAAAENEGAALLVKRTKDAEAEAAFKTIGAEAEKKAAALRGEGLALFRKNIADGMKDAAESLRAAGVDANFLLYLEYTDALKYVADHSQGKVIFMDNGAGTPARIVQSIIGMGAESPPSTESLPTIDTAAAGARHAGPANALPGGGGTKTQSDQDR